MTTTWYVIPITPSTPQVFSTTLLQTSYNMRTRFSVGSLAWMLDIYDVDNNLIVGSIPLVTGADLLEQYKYLGIGGGLYISNSGSLNDAVPQFNDLGVNGQLVFIPY